MEKFCEVIETETTQILIKKEYDCDKDCYFVSIETEIEDCRVVVSPNMSKGTTEEQHEAFFQKMVNRARENGDDFIKALLNL